MKRYHVTASILLSAICLLLASASAAETPTPNIVFFLVDDLGGSDVGCYGGTFYETPNIDRLAAAGVRFTDAYAACHVCSPTRAALLTGKYPARTGVTDWIAGRRDFAFQKLQQADNRLELPLEETTIAEALKGQGYATGFFGKWHLGENEFGPLAQGFDVQVPENWFKGWPKAGYHAPFKLEGLPDKPGDYLTDRLTDKALTFMEEKKDQPFLLYLSHFAVHDPIQGRPDLVEKYRKKRAAMKKQDGPDFILEGNPDDPEPLRRADLIKLAEQASHAGFNVLPQRTVKIKQHQDNVEFAAMVEAMDESLGRVLQKLEELELDENTVVIFTSDNGGMSGANLGNPRRVVSPDKLDLAFATSNLPLRGAKGWLYEGGIRVPLIIKWPGYGKPAMVCSTPAHSIDFFPTILDMIGKTEKMDVGLDGVSLGPLLRGNNIAGRSLFWDFPHYSNHGMQSPGGAIREGRYKLLEYFENGSMQLFDLEKDLGEQVDVSAAKPETVKRLQARLREWRKRVGAPRLEPNPEYRPAEYPFSKSPAK